MNILLLQGGAKKNGNTAKVLEWVKAELIGLGHDVETVYQAVVFFSPLYFWGVNAQLKSVIDRTYSLYTTTPEHISLVEGRRQGLLMTGGGPFDNNAAEAFTAFGRMQKYHKSINAAELFVGGCSTPDQMDASVKDQACEFARKLTDQI